MGSTTETCNEAASKMKKSAEEIREHRRLAPAIQPIVIRVAEKLSNSVAREYVLKATTSVLNPASTPQVCENTIECDVTAPKFSTRLRIIGTQMFCTTSARSDDESSLVAVRTRATMPRPRAKTARITLPCEPCCCLEG